MGQDKIIATLNASLDDSKAAINMHDGRFMIEDKGVFHTTKGSCVYLRKESCPPPRQKSCCGSGRAQ